MDSSRGNIDNKFTPRIAKSAGAVEYIDWISAECPVYDTKQSDG